MPIVAVIDYGMGNIDSMRRALEECGARVVIARGPDDLLAVTHMVLPGVGSFSAAIRHLVDVGFPSIIKTLAEEKKIPLLGVCLGMQLLASRGEEGGVSEGLGLIQGRVTLLKETAVSERIPHVGWNEVHPVSASSRLLSGMLAGADFYFVHSYHFVTDHASDVAASTPYCGGFSSVVEKGCVFGTQFHPEKSQRTGMKLLRNFLNV